MRDVPLKIDERQYQPQTITLANPTSNKTLKDGNGIIVTLALNEESPSEGLNSFKAKQSVNSDHKKLSTLQKNNILNHQINEMINSLNPNLSNKKSDAVIKETHHSNIIKIKNPNLISSNNENNQGRNSSNYSSDPNIGKIMSAKLNGKLNKTNVQDQSNYVNQKINLNKYNNNNNDQVSSSNLMNNFNTTNMNKLINQGNFNNTNLNSSSLNNINNNFSAQQQMQIMNQFNNISNLNNPMQMMNKIAMNLQNQNNMNFINQTNPSVQMNNIPQQSLLNNINMSLINGNNPNQNMNKIVFPNPNAGINQPAVNSHNKNLSFSSNFLHLLNKNYIESKLSSLAHVKILNPVYRNAIIPVVPELFSKSLK